MYTVAHSVSYIHFFSDLSEFMNETVTNKNGEFKVSGHDNEASFKINFI